MIMVSRRGFFRLIGGAAATLHLKPLMEILPEAAPIPYITETFILPKLTDHVYKASPAFKLLFKPKIYSATVTIRG